ncbi:uncharacterized protein LOC122526000 [Polistes fuscatus]|uniref:uncharacterized protein LOC106791812 n=1 Tax=Polistes canadensis TaxID=91411 RepID=UPI000718FC15|nr:PREDICTED: uncharacterized protein LOC106791812 [Polistes canadensis]XP_043505002.1 uncharacterized protein LOC122526000 [Polistes fuscatus]XP_043505003.1 uncharacterized protein LOC122526000 [Polistes fuscatus]
MDLALLLLVVLLRQEVAALKLLHINVPAYTLRGKNAILECSYDLESDKLYSFSWYKDHEEFYRYVPRSDPTQHSYHVEGIKVDHRHSNNTRVQLQDVSFHTSGRYKCEVVAEAPNFYSVIAEANMEVIALPQESPKITGEEKIYASGDVLALNCTSDRSHPGAHLKWFINDEQVKADLEGKLEQHGMISMVSSLRLKLEPDHLSSEKINVRCEAIVQSNQEQNGQIYDVRTTEVFVQGQASLLRPSACLLLTLFTLQRLLLPL